MVIATISAVTATTNRIVSKQAMDARSKDTPKEKKPAGQGGLWQKGNWPASDFFFLTCATCRHDHFPPCQVEKNDEDGEGNQRQEIGVIAREEWIDL